MGIREEDLKGKGNIFPGWQKLISHHLRCLRQGWYFGRGRQWGEGDVWFRHTRKYVEQRFSRKSTLEMHYVACWFSRCNSCRFTSKFLIYLEALKKKKVKHSSFYLLYLLLFLLYQFMYCCSSRKSCFKAGHLPCNMHASLGSPQNQVLIMNSIFTSHIVSTGIGKRKKKKVFGLLEYRISSWGEMNWKLIFREEKLSISSAIISYYWFVWL